MSRNMYFHQTLTVERWQSLPKTQQILNIAAEFRRAMRAAEKQYTVDVGHSLDRVLELFDATIGDQRWGLGGRRELLRLREIIGTYYGYSEYTISMRQSLKIIFSLDPSSSIVTL